MSEHSAAEQSLSLSLSTLIEASPLLGHVLEDRQSVRNRQEETIIRNLQSKSTVTLHSRKTPHKESFYFGCIDYLIYEESQAGQPVRKIYPIEFNGTGMAGVTNMSLSAFHAILDEFKRIPEFLTPLDATPIFLVPVSGTRSLKSSATGSLIYERILYAQAIKEGMQAFYGAGVIRTLPELVAQGGLDLKIPTVVLGHHKDFIEHLSCRDGRVLLFGQPVAGSIRDQFCDNLVSHFSLNGHSQIDFDTFYPVNPLFHMAGDKGFFYGLVNDFLQKESRFGMAPSQIIFSHAETREDLIRQVMHYTEESRRVVIKPHAAGLGRGIDFFMQRAPQAEITRKIDESVAATERFYGSQGGAFPYTICEFIDSVPIRKPDHHFYGHKYELRIMLYRQGDELKAFPSIAKVASQRYEAESPDRLMLLNNVAVSSNSTQLSGEHFMLPLANRQSLDVLDLSEDELAEICRFSTHLIAYGIQSLETVDNPHIWIEHVWPEHLAGSSTSNPVS